ncbi:MAG TPA: hypothetical protein VE715_18985, partial [Blastocatellia bacterium]|nr:hypothetical protein [Blastocatellia bacterium]
VARRCGEENEALIVTEMLPRLGELWLPDAEGNRYASELRMIAVDLGETSVAVNKSKFGNNG